MQKEIAEKARCLYNEIEEIDYFLRMTKDCHRGLSLKKNRLFFVKSWSNEYRIDIPKRIQEKVFKSLKEYRKELEKELEEL